MVHKGHNRLSSGRDHQRRPEQPLVLSRSRTVLARSSPLRAMAPLAHTRGGGCRSASPRPHLFLSLIVMLSALFVPASGFLVSPGGVLPRSGSGAMHSATRSGRLQPAGGLLVNVRRGARFQSSTSETFGCALSVAPDEEEERKRQFEVQRGKAVRPRTFPPHTVSPPPLRRKCLPSQC